MGTTLTDEMVASAWTQIGAAGWHDALYRTEHNGTDLSEWIKGRSKTVWTRPAIRSLIRLNPRILFK